MISEFRLGANGLTEYNKVDNTISLLCELEAAALQKNSEGYYLCYSGGKDSDTLLDIALKSGVKFTANYNVTGIDPTECIKHIKRRRHELKEKGIDLFIHPPNRFTTGIYKGQFKNMWRLIIHKGIPPMRIKRYCCEHLKERGGKGRVCLTGVRWDESTSRKSRAPMEKIGATKSTKILFNDNSENRRQFENCMAKGKLVINPIIDFTTNDIWEYRERENIRFCNLYQSKTDRIGCIGCPMAGSSGMLSDFERHPYIKSLYLQSFDIMLKERARKGLPTNTMWNCAEAVMEWWIYGTDKEQKQIEEQIGFEDEENWEEME